MADFNQTGLGDWYSELLGSARQQLVKLPDGTYVQAPQFGGNTNLNDIYGGILPSAPPPVSAGLTTRKVPTYGTDANGNPVVGSSTGPGFGAPPADPVVRTSGVRPALTQGVQPAGTVAMPPGGRPASVGLPRPPVPPQQVAQSGMFGRGQGGYWDGALKGQQRLPMNDGGEAGFLSTFYPDKTTAAEAAIEQAAPMPPMPRVRPIPPAKIPLTSVAPPKVTGAVPTIPGAITFRKGDTVSALAKRLGMTTSSFADRYGIANPNKIYAGQTVTPVGAPVPRMPPAGLMRSGPSAPAVPLPRPRPRESFDQVWAEAKGY